MCLSTLSSKWSNVLLSVTWKKRTRNFCKQNMFMYVCFIFGKKLTHHDKQFPLDRIYSYQQFPWGPQKYSPVFLFSNVAVLHYVSEWNYFQTNLTAVAVQNIYKHLPPWLPLLVSCEGWVFVQISGEKSSAAHQVPQTSHQYFSSQDPLMPCACTLPVAGMFSLRHVLQLLHRCPIGCLNSPERHPHHL